MTITRDQLLENAFVITVNENRISAFMRRWDLYGLNRPKIFRGFRLPLGDHEDCVIKSLQANCSYSHYALVKMAEALDLPFIFILEDDALPCKHILEKIDEALTNIPDDTNLLKLGWFSKNKKYVYRDGKNIDAKSYGAHAYIVFKRYYREYEEIFNTVRQRADESLMNDRKGVIASLPVLFAQKNPTEDYNNINPGFISCIKNNTVDNKGGDDFDW